MTSSTLPTSPSAPRPRVAIAYLIAAVAISAGVPGLLPFDVTGATRNFGLFNISSEWRLAVFGATGLAVASLALIWDRIVVGAAAQQQSGAGLRLLTAFFGWLALVTFVTVGSMADLALAYYRLAEWALTIFVIWNLLPSKSDLPRFEQLVRIVSLTALIVVLAMLILLPAVAQTPSTGPLGIQLGGTAYHPNYFAVVLALGALYWSVTSRHPAKFVIVPIMLVCWILTGSRSGLAGGAAAMIAFALLAVKGTGWLDRFVFRAGILVVVCLAGLAFLPEIWSVLSRGDPSEDLSQLNARTLIWPVAIEFAAHAPFLGYGFIVGPRRIGESFPVDWLAPSHAHNDILNAAVAGGVPAALLLATVFALMLMRAFRVRTANPLLAVTGIPILLTAMVEPLISSHAPIIGVLAVGLFRALALSRQPR